MKSFKSFAVDMGRRPEGCTLDRIDNSGDYTPENCRWATTSEQNNNTRVNRHATIDGRTQTVQQWCHELGVDSALVYNRLHRGWSEADAILTPNLRHSA